MGKKSFNRKKAVRFVLAPGPEKDGKPSVLFKPVETRKTQLSKKQRKEVISKLGDYEQITINGKQVDEHDIPAFVLEQIRGRSNLLYNQIHQQQDEEEQEIGDIYEIQDAPKDQGQYSEYEDDQQQEEQSLIREEEDDQDWEDQEQIEEQQVDQQEEIIQKYQQKYILKEEDFPQLPALQKVQIEGREYELTKSQIEILNTIIPQNYQQMDFGGLRFQKYNEDGLPLSQKQKYQPYLLGDNQKVVVVDTYEYVPTHAVNTVDNDLKPSQITKNLNIKAVEDALNYQGEQEVYEELEDDFFAKLIRGQLQTTKQAKIEQKSMKKEQSKTVRVKQQKSVPATIQKQLDQKLQAAIFNYEHNIEQNHPKNNLVQQDSDQEEKSQSNTNLSMNFTDLQKRQEYLGKDGELDWRMLTKKEKREYMKTKVIREYYDELRQREIEDKMKGISNVRPEQLHLKQLVKHIPYQEDHVMQKALAEDLQKDVHLSGEDDQYESLSDEEDDIVSFHQKTSIIATNLSVIEEPRKKKTVAANKQKEPEQNESDMTKIKVIPEQRNRNQTKEQRHERKKKLKELKKERREQRAEFIQKFNQHKKQNTKRQNPNNPLSKVSLVKIY